MTQNLFAQNFFRSYGNADEEVAHAVIETKDTAYFLFGTTSSFYEGSSNFYLIRIDSTGNYEWSKVYGAGGVEQGWDISRKPDGNYWLAGYSNSFSNGGYDIYLVEIDSLGNELSAKTHGGDDWDFAYGILSLPNNESIVTGSTYSYGNGNQDGFLLRIDQNGDSLQMQTFGGTGEDVLRETILLSTGELLSIGYKTSAAGDKDIYLLKFHPSGDTIWTKTYGTSSDDEGFSIAESIHGTYIIAGYTEGLGAGAKDGYEFGVDTSGNFVWEQTYGGANDDIFRKICLKDGEFRFYAALETNSYGNGENDFTVLNLLSNGGWYASGNTYGTAVKEIPYDIIQTSHKKVLVVGSTTYPYGNTNMMAVMTDTLFNAQTIITSYTDVNSVEENYFENNMLIHPNPSNGIFTIMSENINEYFEIFNLQGELVYSGNTNEVIDVSFLPSSVYLLRLQMQDGRFSTGKIILSRQ